MFGLSAQDEIDNHYQNRSLTRPKHTDDRQHFYELSPGRVAAKM